MSTSTDQHERLLYGLSGSAAVDMRAGRHADGRATMLATLAEVGLELDGPLPADAPTAVTAIVLAVSIEAGVSVFVVPDDAITPALQAALERCDGVNIDHMTEVDDPELHAAYQEIGTATAAEPWSSGYALGPASGQLRAARFAGRFTRVYFIHEWL